MNDKVSATLERYQHAADQAKQAQWAHRDAVQKAERAAQADRIRRWIKEGRTHLDAVDSNGKRTEPIEVTRDQLTQMLWEATRPRYPNGQPRLDDNGEPLPHPWPTV